MRITKKLINNPHKLLSELHNIVEQEAILRKEFRRAKYTFWGYDYPFYIDRKDAQALEIARGRFLEWFLFDIRFKSLDKKNPAQWYVDKNKDTFTNAEYKLLREMTKSKFLALQLEERISLREFKCINLSNGKYLKIITRKNQKNFRYGNCLVGRIFFWQGDFILSDFFELLSNVSLFGQNKKAFFNSLDAFVWEKFYKLQYKGEHPIQKTQKLEQIKKKLKPFLYAVSENQLTISHLLELLRKKDYFPEFVKAVEKNINFRNKEEFKTFVMYLQALWIHTPRKELGGKSISEMALEKSAGKIERKLLEELFDYIYENANPSSYPNFNVAKKEILKIQKKWMNTKRKDLKGLTPKQAILKERELAGNTSKKIEMGFNLYGL